MTQDQLRRTEGQRARHYKMRTIETRRWAFAEVTRNSPVTAGRSLLLLSNTDNGKVGWHDYGPRDLIVGTHVELFEFRVYGTWRADFRVLGEDE